MSENIDNIEGYSKTLKDVERYWKRSKFPVGSQGISVDIKSMQFKESIRVDDIGNTEMASRHSKRSWKSRAVYIDLRELGDLDSISRFLSIFIAVQ